MSGSSPSFAFLKSEVEEILALLAKTEPPRRVVVGIAGPPGVGKSTVAEALAQALNATVGGEVAAVVPMDGFHLLNEQLVALGLRDRKGAPETFDAEGFAALLPRVGAGEAPLPIPTYSRALSRPVPGGIVLEARHRIALVEGNYLYLNFGGWTKLYPLFDRRLFLTAEREECRRRLVPRHIASGKTPEHAARHVETVDLDNYDRIHAALEGDRPGRDGIVIYENQ